MLYKRENYSEFNIFLSLKITGVQNIFNAAPVL